MIHNRFVFLEGILTLCLHSILYTQTKLFHMLTAGKEGFNGHLWWSVMNGNAFKWCWIILIHYRVGSCSAESYFSIDDAENARGYECHQSLPTSWLFLSFWVPLIEEMNVQVLLRSTNEFNFTNLQTTITTISKNTFGSKSFRIKVSEHRWWSWKGKFKTAKA